MRFTKVNYGWIFLQTSLFLLLLFLCLKTYGFYILNKTLLMGSVVFYVFYWIFSIFVFSWKKNQSSINTSVIYRFWRRALVLFWSIEIFTFSIFVYCLLNAPNEIYYILDNSDLWHAKDYVRSNWFFLFSIIISLIVVSVLVILQITNNLLVLVYLLISHLLLLFLIGEEYKDLLFIYNVFFEKQLVFAVELKLNETPEGMYVDNENHFTDLGLKYKNVFQHLNPMTYNEITLNQWSVENEKNKTKTFRQCLFAIAVLKWLHILFIYTYFLTFTYFSLTMTKHSVSGFSGHAYNLGFLAAFYLMYYIPLVKYNLNLSYSMTYYWFFENINVFWYSTHSIFTTIVWYWIVDLVNFVLTIVWF